MPSIRSHDDYRKDLAKAVTSAGLKCYPYRPHPVSRNAVLGGGPFGFVDDIQVAFYGSGGDQSTTGWGSALVTIVSYTDAPGYREDHQKVLEGLIHPVTAALSLIRGLTVNTATTTTFRTDPGREVTAVIYTVSFRLSTNPPG